MTTPFRFWLVFVLLLALLALVVVPVGAQAEPPGDPLDDAVTDVTDFIELSHAVIAVLVLLVTQVIKFITKARTGEDGLPESTSQHIYLGVVVLFALIYFIGNLTGYIAELQSGVAFLTVLADPIMMLLTTLFGSSALYAAGRAVDNPIVAGRQGAERFAFKEPEPVALLSRPTVDATGVLIEAEPHIHDTVAHYQRGYDAGFKAAING